MTRNTMMRAGLAVGAAGLLGFSAGASATDAPRPDGMMWSGTEIAPAAPHAAHAPRAPRAPVAAFASPHGEEFSIITTEDDQKYEVIVNKDGVNARVNGLRLSPDRVVKSDNQVILLDDAGKEMKVISLSPRVSGLATFPGSRFNIQYDDDVIERPPVMLGVLLEPAGDALHAHLDLPEHALVLEKVMEGLPAEKAGLKTWDIVIEVNGKPLDNEKMLHEALMDSEPGDSMEFAVIRRGKEIDVEIELAAYDNEALGNNQVSVESIFPQSLNNSFSFFGSTADQKQELESARRALEEAMRAMETENGAAGQQMDEARREIERAMRQLEAQRRGSAGASRAWRLDPQGRLLRQDTDDQNEDMLESLEDAFEDRLEDLEDEFEDRMEELEDRWEQVEEMLDRMFTRFEQRLDEALSERRRNRDD